MLNGNEFEKLSRHILNAVPCDLVGTVDRDVASAVTIAENAVYLDWDAGTVGLHASML